MHMSSMIAFKPGTLLGTHRKRTCLVGVPQVSNSIRHADKTHILNKERGKGGEVKVFSPNLPPLPPPFTLTQNQT